MKQVIVYEDAAGALHVVRPVDQDMPLEEIAARAAPPGAAWRIVSEAELPGEPASRPAWRLGRRAGGPAVTVDLDRFRAAARQEVETLAAEAGDHALAGATAAEIASWPLKLAEARAALGGARSPILEAEAARTGENVEDLARLIAARAEAWGALAAAAAGVRRRAVADIASAPDSAAVTAAVATARAGFSALASKMVQGDPNNG